MTTNNFRKLTKEEIAELFHIKHDKNLNICKDFVRKYYPKTVVSFEILVQSEYNDSTYDNRLRYIIAYDKNGNEVPPNKATAKEARQKIEDLYLGDSYNETNEALTDITVVFDDIELYVKED